jgi:hypothetical protein
MNSPAGDVYGFECVGFVHLDAGCSYERYEFIVEFFATSNSDTPSVFVRQWKFGNEPARRAPGRIFHDMERRQSRWVDADAFELSQCRSRESVATTFVPWEFCLVDDGSRETGSMKGECGAATGRAGADNECV